MIYNLFAAIFFFAATFFLLNVLLNTNISPNRLAFDPTAVVLAADDFSNGTLKLLVDDLNKALNFSKQAESLTLKPFWAVVEIVRENCLSFNINVWKNHALLSVLSAYNGNEFDVLSSFTPKPRILNLSGKMDKASHSTVPLGLL